MWNMAGIAFLLATALSAHSHEVHHDATIDIKDFRPQAAFSASAKDLTWLEKYGPQIDQPFSGPLSFSHLPYARCLENDDMDFDIAILGMPFDTGVRVLCSLDQIWVF